jgi:hypothetical protein
MSIGITNQYSVTLKLEKRIRSRFDAQHFIVSSLNFNENMDILKKKMEIKPYGYGMKYSLFFSLLNSIHNLLFDVCLNGLNRFEIEKIDVYFFIE